ncbi:hypothetical protein T06_16756 [Trichinella sp. T6]|nr:hypothetical protein T06_16756 [Trichinella sp. T6]
MLNQSALKLFAQNSQQTNSKHEDTYRGTKKFVTSVQASQLSSLYYYINRLRLLTDLISSIGANKRESERASKRESKQARKQHAGKCASATQHQLANQTTN